MTKKAAVAAETDAVASEAFGTPEQVVRGIKRTCLGARNEDATVYLPDLLKQFPQLEKVEVPVETSKALAFLLDNGMPDEAHVLNRMARSGCGADFNDVIMAGELDGKEHDYQCPKCGVKGSYRAPVFPTNSEE